MAMININFVIPNKGNYENYYSDFDGDIDNNWRFFINGEWAWIIQTYHRLIDYGVMVQHQESPLEECINVIFANDYVELKNKNEFYCIVITLDRVVFFPGDLNVIQNKSQKIPFRKKYIPHWSQCGIIPSSDTIPKNDRFKIGFFGLPTNSINLISTLTEEFSDEAEMFTFGPDNWNDYSHVDLAVGIRDFKGKHIHKPPTKLLNAWKAGVPFIGGGDSAYEQVGTNGFDYIRVQSKKELKEKIRYLMNSKEARHLLSMRGKESFSQYSDRSLVFEWEKLLFAEREKFQIWSKSSLVTKSVHVELRRVFFNYLRIKRRLLMAIGKYK